jgi:hypothetical protein
LWCFKWRLFVERVAFVVAAVVVPVVPVVVVPAVVLVVLVVVVVGGVPPGPVHAHATPPPAPNDATDARTATALR